MAHFAKLDENNVVMEVHVVNNDDVLNLPFPESEAVGIEFLKNWSGGYTNWKQTSYNKNFRYRYACIGDTYDANRDAFIAPKPYPSWVFNENVMSYEPPVPYPQEDDVDSMKMGTLYIWDEPTLSWVVYVSGE